MVPLRPGCWHVVAGGGPPRRLARTFGVARGPEARRRDLLTVLGSVTWPVPCKEVAGAPTAPGPEACKGVKVEGQGVASDEFEQPSTSSKGEAERLRGSEAGARRRARGFLKLPLADGKRKTSHVNVQVALQAKQAGRGSGRKGRRRLRRSGTGNCMGRSSTQQEVPGEPQGHQDP